MTELEDEMEESQTETLAVKTGSSVVVLTVPDQFPKMRASLAKGVAVLEERLKSFDPEAEGAEVDAQDIVAKARNAYDLAVARRDEETKPFDTVLDALSQRWTPLVKAFTALRALAKGKAQEALYARQRREEKLRREAQEKLDAARKAEADAAEALRAKTASAETTAPAQEAHSASLAALRGARSAVDALPPPGAPIGVVSPSGSLKPRRTFAFDVVDMAQVPLAFLSVSDMKVREAIKAHDWETGPLVIPGINIRQETTLVDRRPSKPSQRELRE